MNRVSPELEARMIALVDDITSGASTKSWIAEAEAIKAELPAPVDPDRELVDAVIREQFPEAADPNEWAMRKVALACLKAARQEPPPMTAARFNALSDRVEAATGADRKLDAEIAECAGLRVVDEGHPLGLQCYDSAGKSVRLPAYTASRDAAMTLVPDGWRKDVFDADNGDCICRSDDDDDTEVWARAKTWPLAITAAALRARARAMEGE